MTIEKMARLHARLLDAASRLGSRLPLTRRNIAHVETFSTNDTIKSTLRKLHLDMRMPRGTTASTARCCVTCSSRCTTTRRMGRRCCAFVAAPCMDSTVVGTTSSTHHTTAACASETRAQRRYKRGAQELAQFRAGVERCEDIRGIMVMPHRGRMRMAR